jgi:DNA polymerase I-like protein with 3'-5' exonuclease and polymerase domains
MIQSLASDINLLGAIDLSKAMKEQDIRGGIFALVHDSILAEIHEDDVENYKKLAKWCIQKDRGVSISNTPISIDIDVGDDYSFGKLEAKYPELC